MKTLRRVCFFMFVVLFWATDFVSGQDSSNVVRSLGETKQKPIIYNLWGYGMGARTKHANLWTANNPSYNSDDLFCTHWDVGLCFEISRCPRKISNESNAGLTARDVMNVFYSFRAGLSLGYRHEAFAFQTSNQERLQPGIVQHRLTIETGLKYVPFTMGLVTDFLLKSDHKDHDDFTHVGLNDDCFNRTTFRWYMGLCLPISFVELEARIGWYIVPQLNTNKFAYYNMGKGIWDGMYWELKLSFRIFTTGSKI